MQQARWFSTTIFHSRQALLKEVPKPLAAKQRRTLNNLEAEAHDNHPSFQLQLDSGARKVSQSQTPKEMKRIQNTQLRGSYCREDLRLLTSGPRVRLRGYRADGTYTPDHIFRLSQAPEDIIEKRYITIRRVQKAIQDRFGQRYTLGVFGSTCYGADSATSDLDLVLFDPERPRGWVDGNIPSKHKLPKIYRLHEVASVLSRAGFSKVIPVPAKVPIVKFRDPRTGISCDLNINERLGYCNTQMIRKYCSISPELRKAMTFIKEWAKAVGLNNPSGDQGPVTFSSYALTLMTIALFQTWRALPNLQGDLSPFDPNQPSSFWTALKKQPRRDDFVACDVRWHIYVLGFQARRIPAELALFKWFQYWAEEHKYDETFVSIRSGGLVSRDAATVTRPGKSFVSQKIPIAVDEDGDTFALKKTSAEQQDSPTQDAPGLGTTEINEADTSKDLSPESIDKAESYPFPLPHWSQGGLLVVDPFIVSKNVTGNIAQRDILWFQRECQQAWNLLKTGCTFKNLVKEVMQTTGQPELSVISVTPEELYQSLVKTTGQSAIQETASGRTPLKTAVASVIGASSASI